MCLSHLDQGCSSFSIITSCPLAPIFQVDLRFSRLVMAEERPGLTCGPGGVRVGPRGHAGLWAWSPQGAAEASARLRHSPGSGVNLPLS